jgi:tRNA pseudouridine13 synthase
MVLPVAEIDRLLGIEIYASGTSGVGGVIRGSVDDFVVKEVLVDGSKAQIENQINPPNSQKVLGASLEHQRYLLCVLVKRNWDTFIAIKNIAKNLGIDQNRIQIAGIKDAKAVTAQYITIENVSMEDAAKVNVKDIAVHPVGYVRNPLSLFYLLGNRFTIKIRLVEKEESFAREQLAQIMLELGCVGGIPNFYGHQRFGTTRPITHLVGKAILKGDFEEAALVFLAKASVDEHPSSRYAREELQSSRNFRLALECFPKQLRFERLMLNYLVDNVSDFAGAFRVLPVKLQMLFVQAYQSFLFNRFLSERVKRGLPLGLAEVGDFVVGVERSGLPMVNVAKTVTAESLSKVIESIASGRLRVALPIVGFKQKLSEGIMGEIEKLVLEEEDVNLDGFRVTSLSKLGGRGSLRSAVTPVNNFKLLDVTKDTNGKDCVVSLSFMLFRGCYATVLLREVMKPENPITAGF